MALTPSTMLPLGTPAPHFVLTDVITEKEVALPDIPSIATVILFICNHCPFVKHIRDQLITVARDYQKKGIDFIAISANDANKYLQDGPAAMKIIAEEKQFPFPYLFDKTQTVAKLYHAACTPDLFVFDKNLLCVYRGQFDDSRPGNSIPVTGKDLTDALDAILSGVSVDANQKPSLGCNIKWRE